MISLKKHLQAEEAFNLSDSPASSHSQVGIHGKVTIKDDQDNIILEKENLVTQATRVWLFEQLFKTNASSLMPSKYKYHHDDSRQICLLSVGSGGSDLNANAFTPYVPVFSDVDLGQKVPFIIVDQDKYNDNTAKANPSIVDKLTAEQTKLYYLPKQNPDGTIYYYGKRPDGYTDSKPYGTSRGFNIDTITGDVSFTITFSINRNECRGNVINEIGLWLGKYNAGANRYDNLNLATRLCFDPESLTSLTKELTIDYTLYI